MEKGNKWVKLWKSESFKVYKIIENSRKEESKPEENLLLGKKIIVGVKRGKLG